MKNNKRNNPEVIETITNTDFAKAEKTVKFAKINLIRIAIGMVIAIAASIYTVLALQNGGFDSDYLPISMLLSMAAYLVGGGIFKALKAAGSFAKWGLILVPFFPANLLAGLCTLIMSIFLLLFVPIVFVGKNLVQHKKSLDEANYYLANCARVQQ